MSCIDRAAQLATSRWQPLPDRAEIDPNPIDLLLLAQILQSECVGTTGSYSLPVDEARKIIRAVGDFMLDESVANRRQSNNFLRNRTVEQITAELGDLRRIVESMNTSIGIGDMALVRALSLYSSYLLMAKECWNVAAGGSVIDRQVSLANYEVLQAIGSQIEWIRAGIILVRIVRPNLPMVEDWIPTGSMYWQEL